MRQDASNTNAALRAPLASFEDPDFDDDDQLAEATLSAAGAPNTRRRYNSKRPSLRVLPWVLLAIVAVVFLLSPPGGLSVLICAARASSAPTVKNLQLIGYRGVEWPEPGNTLRSLRVGAFLFGAVLVDVSGLTRDGTAVAVDGRLEHTTNGTGLPCIRRSSYVLSLSVNPPTHDTNGQARRASFCVDKLKNGTRRPCTYRIPTLEKIFADLPAKTQYMLQVDGCDPDSRPNVCGNCDALAEEVKRIAKQRFITPNLITFVAKSPASVEKFMKVLPDARFLLDAGQRYAHLRSDHFVQRKVIEDRWDGVIFSPGWWRPDLGYAVDKGEASRTSKKLERYVGPIRTDWDLKIATCTGARRLVVSDGHHVSSLLKYKRPS